MLFSVIIPVYQAEKTLERCLDSLLQQAEDDMEIILIDDGSPDASGEICDWYAGRYPCVRCIHQENKGVASARNAGLDRARGKYLLFVDSDDFVSPNYFSVIRRELSANDCALLFFRITRDSSALGSTTEKSEAAVTAGETAVLCSKLLISQNLGSLCNKVFSRDIIRNNSLHFLPELRISEDLSFVFSYLLHAVGIRCIGDRLYFYTVDNTESLSKKRRPYLTQQLLLANHMMKMRLEDPSVVYKGKELRTIRNALTWNHYRNAYTAIRELSKFDYSADQRREKTVEVCRQFATSEWKPKDLRSWILSFPIRRHWALIIRLALGAIK